MAEYKRVLLKISGEALAGKKDFGFDDDIVNNYASQVKTCVEKGYQVAIVIGGGNYWRGRQYKMHDQVKSDYIGMLATVMNALRFSDALESMGVKSVVQTAVDMSKFAESYVVDKAREHLENGKVVIFGCGTGSTCFSTDSGAVLRAVEIQADVVLKATMVDGVYDKDPHKYEDAVKFSTITFDEVLQKNLQVIDTTAAALCLNNKMPLMVFDITKDGNIVEAVSGKEIGTTVIF